MYEIYAELLKEKGLKSADVTRATGIGSSTLSEWKKGKHTPGADKLKKIADFLEVSVDYLMTGTRKYKEEWETGSMIGEIANDPELQAVIKHYLSLSEKNKTLVKNLIQSLSD